jgi:hypothetical protein
MSDKKTIVINPELLKVGKTKKNPIKIKPIITSKMIKKSLINRIKENRKKSETKDNEFQESEKFLTEILNKKEKNITVKNHQPLHNYSEMSPISKNVENILFKPNNQSIKLNYKIDDEQPHGCLKNGIKPCFRSYKRYMLKPQPNIVKTKPYSDEDIAKGIIEGEINKAINGKVEFSTDLVKKYQEKQLVITDEDIKPVFDSFPGQTESLNIDVFSEPKINEPESILKPINLEVNPEPIELNMESSQTDEQNNVDLEISETENEPIQIHRIVKRKYTLGKNKNKVGVLMKSKKTKKNIIEFTKELRKIPNEDVKKNLRACGLIKVGSTAPPEILRKIFENVKMAGDVINEDKDILLHNLINCEN